MPSFKMVDGKPVLVPRTKPRKPDAAKKRQATAEKQSAKKAEKSTGGDKA